MEISTSVAIIAGLLFLNTLFFIAVLLKALKAFGEAQRVLETVRLQLAPITHDASQIMSDVRSIVKNAEREMDKIGDSISAVRDTTRNLRDFELLLQERIERPLLDITAVLSALVKGGTVFWNSVKKR